MDELVGAAEIAKRLGLTQLRTVHQWHRRHRDFPEPVVRLSQALIWDWREVRDWARRTGRFPADDRAGEKRATRR